MSVRTLLLFASYFLMFSAAGLSAAEVKLVENLPAGSRQTIEVTTEITGQMTLPATKDAKPKQMSVTGKSQLKYDERALPADDKDTDTLLRVYRSLAIERKVGDNPQTATIRPDVRRLVVLRSIKGKSPFSPDGPLLFSEIDVVKNDLFAPVLVRGLLPNKAVNDGETWDASAEAIRELTDLEQVTAGKLSIKFVGIVTFDGKDRARLSISGSLRGVDDNGPCKHTLDGTAYFDVDTAMLVYLSVKGTHDLLDGEGQLAGRIEGRMTMTRGVSTAESLADDVVMKLELKPTPENTRLLYENSTLGVSFTHPRRWRVGAVQGKQVTLDGPNGAGLLLTLETLKTLPTTEAYLKETQEFLTKEKGTMTNISKVDRVQDQPTKLDRFGFDADLGKESLRLEYAVIVGEKAGVTAAARLPQKDAEALTKDVDVVVKSLRLK
ncbi:hypothetical protein BH11PLA2_BH11PLA2_46100 [soil metagenome]